jgi:hypothetical protein
LRYWRDRAIDEERRTIRGYHLRFYPTVTQQRELAQEFETGVGFWNFALRAKSDAWRRRRECLTWVELSCWLAEIKRDWLPWLKETASTTATQSLLDLNLS